MDSGFGPDGKGVGDYSARMILTEKRISEPQRIVLQQDLATAHKGID